MSSLTLENEPIAVNVTLSAQQLTIDLADGRSMSIPLEWYPRLMNASKVERLNWKLLGDGYAIEWPDIDEHIGIESVIAGRRSEESLQSLNAWLATRADHPKKTKTRTLKPKQAKKKVLSS